MNGKPRDSIATDLRVGRPTISSRGDAVARRVTALMSAQESELLYNELDAHIERSPGLRDWVLDPSQHLRAFDPATASTIETLLDRAYKEQLGKAEGRGHKES